MSFSQAERIVEAVELVAQALAKALTVWSTGTITKEKSG